MFTKKIIALSLVLCLLLAGCAKAPAETTKTMAPLPDSTMENLSDAILAVSLEKGNAFVDDTGKLQMTVTIYTYDKYDMVDVANLEVGDTIARHEGDVKVLSKEQTEAGTICINGGLGEGGFDLATDDNGVFFEQGFNDAKNWYEVGTATLRVSADLVGIDSANPDAGDMPIYPGDLLTDAIADFNFTPHNTTIRVEGGQVVELNRRYTP